MYVKFPSMLSKGEERRIVKIDKNKLPLIHLDSCPEKTSNTQ